MNNLFRELKKLPKIELHAHLSGSVRNSTIIELIKNELLEKRSETQDELNIEKEIEQYQINENKSLKDCFTIFSHLHRLLNNKENLERVTREILKDFADENVIYLELRTTPRVIYDSFSKKVILTKRDYIETIINEIKEFEKCSDMIVRLILSIDRSKTIQEAFETVELCKSFEDNNHIVGIDISGNPDVNNLKEFKEVFQLIKANNQNLTVHVAEIDKSVEETDFILKEIKPNRIGHAVFLDEKQKKYLLDAPIPIEICPSSNLATKSIESLEQHPFNDFYSLNKSYPMCICTDDSGIFNTSTTKEQFLIAETFKLSVQDIFELNKNSISFIFDQSESTINKLISKF